MHRVFAASQSAGRFWAIAAAGMALVARTTVAQGAGANVGVDQHHAGTPTSVPGCTNGIFAPGSATPATVSVDCAYRGTTITAAASAAFSSGLRSHVRVGSGLQDLPVGFANRVSGDAVSYLADQVLVSAAAATPTTLTFWARVTGTSMTTHVTPGGSPVTQTWATLNSSHLPPALFPPERGGGPSAWDEYVGLRYDGSVLEGVARFVGRHTAALVGTTQLAKTDGWVAFRGIPVVAGATDFALGLHAHASVSNVGGAPQMVADMADANFAHTMRLAGVQVFDASGRDITGFSDVTFASGISLLAGNPTTVPEPATVALLAAGLAALSGGATIHRRRVHGQSRA